MGDGKTVNSPLFDDLGGERSIVLQGRSKARMSVESEQPNPSPVDSYQEHSEAQAAPTGEKLPARR